MIDRKGAVSLLKARTAFDSFHDSLRHLEARVTGKRVRYALIAAAVALYLLWCAKYLFIDNRPLDVLLAAVSTLDGDFTVYRDGFRESAFRSLRVGMSARQVEAIMGPSLDVGQWLETPQGQPIDPGAGRLHPLWRYTRPGKQMGDYWQREVWFKDGVVHILESGFYLD
jgi:hypothetical protein